MKERWGFTIDIGSHFKPFDKDKDFDIKKIVDKKVAGFIDSQYGPPFWGEFGISASYGITYKRVFESKKFFWGSRIVWTYFFPDSRWTKTGADITLGFIPYFGKFLSASIDSWPGWVSQLIIPLVYCDWGYITNSGISFSLGLVYLWGLSPTVCVPLTEKLSLEIRQVLFLDKIFGDIGYHMYLMSIGLNFSFKE